MEAQTIDLPGLTWTYLDLPELTCKLHVSYVSYIAVGRPERPTDADFAIMFLCAWRLPSFAPGVVPSQGSTNQNVAGTDFYIYLDTIYLPDRATDANTELHVAETRVLSERIDTISMARGSAPSLTNCSFVIAHWGPCHGHTHTSAHGTRTGCMTHRPAGLDLT